MKVYTKTLKIQYCDECPRAHNWEEKCFMWGKLVKLYDPPPKDCPLPDERKMKDEEFGGVRKQCLKCGDVWAWFNIKSDLCPECV